jgi:lipid-binding SYLF domain-containing protein
MKVRLAWALRALPPDHTTLELDMTTKRWSSLFFSAALLAAPVTMAAEQDAAAKLERDSRAALQALYAKVPEARAFGKNATAILVFPKVTKAGLVVGGQHGEGTLLRGGKGVAYYSTSGVSYGLQAGVQNYGYAMFFMNENALQQLNKADGFEIGVGPSVVVMDQGRARSATTTTMKDDIYAFIFGQKGLMAGLGVQGNKISQIEPK